jgi:transposase
MARKRKQQKQSDQAMLPVLRPNAAGIDIGATEIYVAVPADRDPQHVRCFPTFTQDLYGLADWLTQCGIETVAMESTGVYWIPLFQILEERGFAVYLVNARHVKNVPGRRTDVSDCQWLQFLHSVGLLKASYRPAQEVCAVRALLRHRESLVQMAATHVHHMQKALDQMNLQVHHVISDITGLTGLAIIDAILSGERDAKVLAQLRHTRIKASAEVIAKSLVGDYRPEHLFTLRQSVNAYRSYQVMIADCDREIQQWLQDFEVLTKSPAAGGQDGTDTSRSEPVAPKAKGPNAQSLSAQLRFTSARRKRCLVRLAQTSISLRVPRPLLPGWLSVRTMTSAGAKFYGPELARSRAAPRKPCAWQPSPWRTVNPPSAISIGGCGLKWVPPKRSRPLPTNSRASFTT